MPQTCIFCNIVEILDVSNIKIWRAVDMTGIIFSIIAGAAMSIQGVFNHAP